MLVHKMDPVGSIPKNIPRECLCDHKLSMVTALTTLSCAFNFECHEYEALVFIWMKNLIKVGATKLD